MASNRAAMRSLRTAGANPIPSIVTGIAGSGYWSIPGPNDENRRPGELDHLERADDAAAVAALHPRRRVGIERR